MVVVDAPLSVRSNITRKYVGRMFDCGSRKLHIIYTWYVNASYCDVPLMALGLESTSYAGVAPLLATIMFARLRGDCKVPPGSATEVVRNLQFYRYHPLQALAQCV